MSINGHFQLKNLSKFPFVAKMGVVMPSYIYYLLISFVSVQYFDVLLQNVDRTLNIFKKIQRSFFGVAKSERFDLELPL